MNGFDHPDDRDCCDCTYGYECADHKHERSKREAQERKDLKRKGIDPDASTDGLESLVLHTMCNRSLSDNQKEAVLRVILASKKKK